MKKNSKPVIIFILIFFISVTAAILIYVGVKKKCEVLTKEKVLMEEQLAARQNWRTNLLAQNQMLTSEQRITEIAMNELGMIKRTKPAMKLKADKEKILKISKILSDKYD